ncbi:MAG: HAMP domain-containing protein, partial [Croceibacterium sp.]
MASPPKPISRAYSRIPRWWRRVLVANRHLNIYRGLEIVAASVLVVMVVSSYFALTSSPGAAKPIPSAQAAAMLVGTLIPALALIVLFGRRVAIRRAGDTTARLHVKLVFFFSLVAAVPTLLVAVFASFLFQSGGELTDRSRGILENATNLARGYYAENQRDIADETTAMAGDLRYVMQKYPFTSQDFAEQFYLQVLARELNESAIIQQLPDGKMGVAAIADPDEDTQRERISPDTLKRLQAGTPVVVTPTEERIEAVTPLDLKNGVFLYNARNSDAEAISQWQRAQSVLQSYDLLTEQARVLQLRFNLALFAVSLALVWLAVWFALRFADRQVKPLAQLVTAAREVGSGNYALRVAGRKGTDEIGLLNRAFNRMTEQIESQTDALMGANHQLAERRAFIETVLQSITAGIVSLDLQGQIVLMNTSAQHLLLEGEGQPPLGQELEAIAPQIATLVRSGASSGIVQSSKDGELLTLAVKVAPAADGHVITFEDITRQLLDQRQAAWSDVARR